MGSQMVGKMMPRKTTRDDDIRERGISGMLAVVMMITVILTCASGFMHKDE